VSGGVVRGPSALARWWATRRTLWAMSLMNWAWYRLTAPKDRRDIAQWFIAHLQYMLVTTPDDGIKVRREPTWFDRLRGKRRLVVVDKAGRVRQQRVVSGDLTVVLSGDTEVVEGFVVQGQ
jgi:hypothetical protein